MANSSQTPNHREIIAALSTITNAPEYVTSTNGTLNTSGSGGGGGSGTNANAYTNQVTVSTTQVQVSSSSRALTNGIIIKAPSTNAANIYVGLTGVTTSTGDILEPGDARGYAVNNTNLLYIISVASTTDIISYSGN